MVPSEVKIYTTFDSFEADQVIATLKYHGIPSVKRMEGSGQYVDILFGRMTTHEVSVFVPGAAVEKAIDILTETGFLEEAPEEEH